MGIGAREGGKEGGRRARGREQRAARGAAGASAARPSRLLRLLSVCSARARGGMGWPGGSPCCCPAPPRPRPAGRPPQVSGREAPDGRAAACASRRGGQCRWWSPGGAEPLRGANGRGERNGRARSGVGSPGSGVRGRQGPERWPGAGPAHGHSPAGRLAFARPDSIRRRSVPPRTRTAAAGPGLGRELAGESVCQGFPFPPHIWGNRGTCGLHREFSRSPWALSRTPPSLPVSFPGPHPSSAAGLPAAHPTTAISRKGECGWRVSPNKPRALE